MRVAIVAPANSRRDVQLLVDITQAYDVGYWASHPELGDFYSLGLRYKKEPRHDLCKPWETCFEERFLTLPELLDAGEGDCDDLAPALASMYVARGIDSKARAVVIDQGNDRYHVVVERGDGTIEDPSLALGMLGPRVAKNARANAGVNGVLELDSDRDRSAESDASGAAAGAAAEVGCACSSVP